MDKVAKRRHACGLPVVPIHSLKQRPRQNHPADEKEKINLAFCFRGLGSKRFAEARS